MHADTLYHRMLAQEAATAEAKAAGLPEPQFAPILANADTPTPPNNNTSNNYINNNDTAPISKDDVPPLTPETQELLTPASQAGLRERMKGMTPAERELEERGVVMEARAANETSKQMTDIMEGRKKRREEGNATVGDTVSGWFGW